MICLACFTIQRGLSQNLGFHASAELLDALTAIRLIVNVAHTGDDEYIGKFSGIQVCENAGVLYVLLFEPLVNIIAAFEWYAVVV